MAARDERRHDAKNDGFTAAIYRARVDDGKV